MWLNLELGLGYFLTAWYIFSIIWTFYDYDHNIIIFFAIQIINILFLLVLFNSSSARAFNEFNFNLLVILFILLSWYAAFTPIDIKLADALWKKVVYGGIDIISTLYICVRLGFEIKSVCYPSIVYGV